MCKLTAYIVPVGTASYFSGSSVTPMVNCEEHNWQDCKPVDGLCPIGRIEKAIEEGLAKLKVVSETFTEGS